MKHRKKKAVIDGDQAGLPARKKTEAVKETKTAALARKALNKSIPKLTRYLDVLDTQIAGTDLVTTLVYFDELPTKKSLKECLSGVKKLRKSLETAREYSWVYQVALEDSLAVYDKAK